MDIGKSNGLARYDAVSGAEDNTEAIATAATQSEEQIRMLARIDNALFAVRGYYTEFDDTVRSHSVDRAKYTVAASQQPPTRNGHCWCVRAQNDAVMLVGENVRIATRRAGTDNHDSANIVFASLRHERVAIFHVLQIVRPETQGALPRVTCHVVMPVTMLATRVSRNHEPAPPLRTKW